MNIHLECMEWIKRFYIGETIQTVVMDGGDALDEQCLQTIVVELLRDLIDNPIPEGILIGGPALNEYVDFSLRKVLLNSRFDFTQKQEDAIKNLAFNYYFDGIRKVQSDPKLKGRLIQIKRTEQMKQ